MEDPNYLTYTLKLLINDTIRVSLEPYKDKELLLPKQYRIPYTTYFYSSYEVPS